MNIDFSLLIRALGLAFVIEGIAWASCPDKMRNVMQKISELDDREIRSMGLMAMGIGLFVVWLAV